MPFAMLENSKWADSASGMQRSKVIEAKDSMIEKEVMKFKYKGFVVALYLMGMYSNKAEEQVSLLSNLLALESSASVRYTCTQAESNLDNYVSVIYDT